MTRIELIARAAARPRCDQHSQARRRLPVLFMLLLTLAACDSPQPNAATKKEPKNQHLVELAAVEQSEIQDSHTHSGTLRARRRARIYTQESGKILQLPYYAGDHVEQGALLARLDTDVLQAELDQAAARLRQAEQDLRRLQNLAKNKLISEDELSRAETAQTVAQAALKVLRLRLERGSMNAPFAGIISERHAEPGDAVTANTHLLSLLDPTSLVAEIQVPDRLLAQAREGDAATVWIDALAGEWPGQVTRLHPALDETNRQGVVEITLRELPPQARSGQFCRAKLHSRAVPRLHIPYTALRRDLRGEFVFSVDAAGKASRVTVQSGEHLGERIEILTGLSAGQHIVSRGLLGLREGKAVITAADEGRK